MLTLLSAFVSIATPVYAHDEHPSAAHGGTSTDGVPGNPSEVSRTVRIEARDTAFNVKQIQVRQGETIKFLVANKGELRHEFSIASHSEHAEHRAMMQQMPDMIHNDPNVITIEPGQTRELIWKFGKDTNVEFACDLPGHAEQGMAGVFRTMR
jgi:uncharacterized cupredoxin-like copper-binding protein